MKTKKRGKKELRKKRAVFFSTDALIALLIIFLVILVAYPIAKLSSHESKVNVDVIDVLSNLKVREINNTDFQQWISDGIIVNLNNSVLEQIGEFYVTNLTLAKIAAQSVLESLNTTENIGIWYGNNLLASINSSSIENADNIRVARQTISGIKSGESVTGFSARAFLSNSLQKKYFYFGGYVGDGNISARLDYEGNINSAEIELVINNDFDLYVNSVFIGNYEKSSSEFTPVKYSVPIDNFQSGTNLIEFKGKDLYIAGGYLKIAYESEVQYEQPERYYFPGIDGIINLYDGFYVPGELDSMDISLHLDSNYTVFLIIGNTSVFEDSTDGEETISIDNAELSSLLDYSDLSEKTIPLRLGIENASYLGNLTTNADVFSVTDLSGSMCGLCLGGEFICCHDVDCRMNQERCEFCGGTCHDKIYDAKDANKIFIDGVLNVSGNRVGLVGYKDTANDTDFHSLSDDVDSLKNKVDDWKAVGETCICCGINKAVDSLIDDSDESRFRSMVVMSDGWASVECAEQGTGDPQQDAIQAACDAYANYGIVIHAIGFGDGADEDTLQAIAACGNGSYYYSTVDELAEVYADVAEDIIEASYREQTVEILGQLYMKLYYDSYIEFDYVKEEIPYGLITTSEKQFYNSYYGNFSIPENADILETKVASYSGPRWTNTLEINDILVYNLSNYGENYIELGDPYSINIPNSLVGENNTVRLTTALSPENSTSGSEYNKIIYTILQNASSYSPISASAEGCIWTIDFNDGTNLTLNVPTDYSGTSYCYYQETLRDYNSNDAVQTATYNLLEDLDFDKDNKLDVKFTEQDLQITMSEITGIPYTWSTEVQVRGWW